MSLIEVVLAAAMVGLVALAFAGIYAASQRYLIQDVNITASQGDASYAIDHMTRHLIQATTVTLDSTSTQITFDWNPTPTSALTSRYQRADTGELQFVPDTTKDTANVETIARGVQNQPIFSFPAGYPNGRLVDIDLTVQVQTTSGSDGRKTRLNTSVSPRGVPGL